MAIIEAHIKKWAPVWSNFLNEVNDFSISSATIRKEMNKLEKLWLIKQPHTSSWRVPTEAWYKEYLNNHIEISDEYREEIRRMFSQKKEKYYLNKARERVYDATAIVSSLAVNVAFATIPDNTKTIYLWIANILKQPEFEDIQKTSSIIEVFEWGLMQKLNDIDINSNEVKVFVWDENIFHQFSSCSMLAIKYSSYNYQWVIWILWPMRMNYPQNIALLEECKAMIEGESYVKKLK